MHEAAVGYDLAEQLRLDVGDTITAGGRALLVVGIYERLIYDTHTDFNYRIEISLETLRRVLHGLPASGHLTMIIPPARYQEDKAVFLEEMRQRLHVDQVLTIEDRLAESAGNYPGTQTLTLTDAEAITRHARGIYANVLILLSAFLLGLSSLAVTGTMGIRLAEDEQRIGLSKALGADEGMLFGEYLHRSAILGIIGGLLGVLGGWAITAMLNQLAASGTTELLFTPRLGAGVFFFTVLMAVLSSVAPASRAARQDASGVLYASPSAEGQATLGGVES
jgi:ABC-type antimicrobial peptide transport system permease subunit